MFRFVRSLWKKVGFCKSKNKSMKEESNIVDVALDKSDADVFAEENSALADQLYNEWVDREFDRIYQLLNKESSTKASGDKEADMVEQQQEKLSLGSITAELNVPLNKENMECECEAWSKSAQESENYASDSHVRTEQFSPDEIDFESNKLALEKEIEDMINQPEIFASECMLEPDMARANANVEISEEELFKLTNTDYIYQEYKRIRRLYRGPSYESLVDEKINETLNIEKIPSEQELKEVIKDEDHFSSISSYGNNNCLVDKKERDLIDEMNSILADHFTQQYDGLNKLLEDLECIFETKRETSDKNGIESNICDEVEESGYEIRQDNPNIKKKSKKYSLRRFFRNLFRGIKLSTKKQ